MRRALLIAALACLGAPLPPALGQEGLLDRVGPAISALEDERPEEAIRLAEEALAALPAAPEDALARRQLRAIQVLAGGAVTLSAASPTAEELGAFTKAWREVGAGLEVVDVPVLVAVVAAAPAPARPFARRWLQLARDKAREIETVQEYLTAMSMPDAALRALATAVMARRLARIRQLVHDGGELDSDAQRLLLSRTLVDALIDQLSREPSDAALDALPPLEVALETWQARALHALALIEEPALTSLLGARFAGVRRSEEAIAAVNRARERRLARFPKSTWASAAGADPLTRGAGEAPR